MFGKSAFAATAAALTILLSNVLIADAQPVRRVLKGNLVLEGIPDTPPALRERLRMYQAVRGSELMDFAPDGRGILITTRFGETSQLHRVDEPGGVRRQITFYDEPVTTAEYRPTTKRRAGHTILMQRDTRGNEVYQLYLVDEKSGDISRLSDGQSQNSNAVFSHDGAYVAWTSVAPDSSRSRILVAEVGKKEAPEKVLEEDGTWVASAFSSDDGELVVVKEVSAAESQIWRIDLDAGTKTQLDPSPAKILRQQPRFSNDGRYLFYISDENSEFRRLIRYDLRRGRKDVFTGNLPWDIEHFELSPDGRTLAFVINDNGASQLDVWDIRRGRKLGGPKLPPGEIENLKFSPDSRNLGFTLNGTTGRDVFVWDVRRRRLTQWTNSEVGGLDRSAFVAPKQISYPTFDEDERGRRMIPAYLYEPTGDGPFPVLIYLHGGPESQFRPNFSAFIQYLVLELKIAVLAPNVRGSTGYGKAYVELDNGKKRTDAVKDIGAAIDWIGKQRELNAQRIGLYGGSYGGYLTYATMIDYGNKVAAGISASGISNFVTFLTNISGYRRDQRRPEYGDERDPQMRNYLDKISPLTNASRIKKPLLIIAGANDPRVPASEAEQMLRAVRANGADAWYLLARNEGNGFQRKSNRDAENAAIAAFLKLKLLGQRLQ
ncbi:MAG: prolyl oligopeptidase family serine peptidase [Alphaproteobacteria bacterium]|nr:prolyl oligopeptidase family serine peptidase [Alphaproteobacteria bacterium]